jgi:hypothetical protein
MMKKNVFYRKILNLFLRFYPKNNIFLVSTALFFAMLITLSRTVRLPNHWATAHWLVGYHFGFVKRGMIGTLLTFFPIQYRELEISFFATSHFILLCFALFVVSIRIIRNECFNVEVVLIAILFLTSPFIVMSAYLNGYFDNTFVLLAIFSCFLVRKNKINYASLLICIGILIHESTIIVGYPSVLFFSFLKHTKENPSMKLNRLIFSFMFRYKSLCLMPIFTFGCLLVNQTFLINSIMVREKLREIISQFEFVKYDRHILVPDAITRSFFDYFESQTKEFFGRIFSSVFLYHVGMPLLIMAYYGWKKLQARKMNGFVFFLFIGVILIPASIHLIAWDTSRIWTYSLLAAFLAIWSIGEIFPADKYKSLSSLFVFILLLILITLQIFTSMPLIDGRHERFSCEARILFSIPLFVAFAIWVEKKYYFIRKIELRDKKNGPK